MELYDAGVGDVIALPTHHPHEVTITRWLGGFGTKPWIWGLTQGDLAQFSWTAPGWSGVTSMSEAAEVVLVRKAPPDDPIRLKYDADNEAALDALLATTGED